MNWWDLSCCVNKSLKDSAYSWSGLCPLNKYSRAWNTLFFASVWSMWEVRNNKVFKGKQTSILQAADVVKLRLVWWFKFHRKDSNDTITLLLLNLKDRCIAPICSKPIHANVWSLPSLGCKKFNVDGSTVGNPGNAGIGGVLRDSLGKVLGLFSLSVGIQDSNTAEIMAFHRACTLCAASRILVGKEVSFVSDSKVAA
ncbi:hypothetical protein Ddye_030388 [Dipteronia dyeriana]|uniref:RNase H type-1 domain-containing protein n=1 Tax=Dipteronia dyeriana TaxID=168575 RepID=A0AAD9WLI7_9ROSI|nr:hypothetical protein Ddye_030388 [Dipteronia dyeriana]